jgi:hypothetical protein
LFGFLDKVKLRIGDIGNDGFRPAAVRVLDGDVDECVSIIPTRLSKGKGVFDIDWGNFDSSSSLQAHPTDQRRG